MYHWAPKKAGAPHLKSVPGPKTYTVTTACNVLMLKLDCLSAGVVRRYRHQFHKAIAGARDTELLWQRHQPESGPTVTERYSHSACYYNKSVYVFGGIFVVLSFMVDENVTFSCI